MLEIAKWYNNFQSPAVLMIDDLSDAYIDVYAESYKNDWGYMCDTDGSSFNFLKKELLATFPQIKITFFTPYLKHNVINENSQFKFKKFALGERAEYTEFLKRLNDEGHEIAHHGSDHGKYIDESIPSTVNNWIHEWALFKDVNSGVTTTLAGGKKFKEACDIDVVGGKYCGYIMIDNSQEIIDQCKFLYWCDKPSYNIGEYNENFFGKNNIISFPTNLAGNSFVRLTYLSGDESRDKKKKVFKYLQPLYNIYSYINLYKLYKKQQIISIQEHNSPSTTAAIVQSANIVTDIESLKKIFGFLSKLSIWYANCKDIAKYIYIRENTKIKISNDQLEIYFNNKKNIMDSVISVISEKPFILENNNQIYTPIYNNGSSVINIPITGGKNIFNIKKE